jgi:hypothetical protein
MFTQAFRHSLLFVVLALVLVGCSTEHTLADGSSVTVISGWVYGTRMAICVLFGFLALLAGSQFQENENVGFLLIAFCLGGVALYSFPGLEGPEELLESAQERAEGELSDKATEAAERALRIEESDREAEQVRREAATKKAEALSPGGRATAVRAKLKELDQRVREQKQVVGRRAPELAKYKRDLRRLRRKSGLKSHQELAKAGKSANKLRRALSRAARLQKQDTFLRSRITRSNEHREELEDKLWELERQAEINGVISEEETRSLERLLASAEATIEESLPVDMKQDLAAIEAQLFEEALK